MSRMVMSLENLVVILPIGLESKKTMLALRTFSAIVLCIFVLACSHKVYSMSDRMKTISIYAIVDHTNLFTKVVAACCSSKSMATH